MSKPAFECSRYCRPVKQVAELHSKAGIKVCYSWVQTIFLFTYCLVVVVVVFSRFLGVERLSFPFIDFVC